MGMDPGGYLWVTQPNMGILERYALNWNFITLILVTEDGKAQFRRVRRDTLDFDEGIDGETYHVLKSGLYEDEKVIYTRIIFELLKIRFYWILFNEGDPWPLGPWASMISPNEVYLVGNSTILRKALLEALGKGVSSKLLIIVIILLVVVIYYILTGGRLY